MDFAITKDKKLESLIEAKWSDDEVSKNLVYYSEKLNPSESLQLVANLKREYHKNKLEVLSARKYLAKF
ncbi:MAG: hypothetical protein SFU98_04920 [Leptospiraceae bacterium]|nr:hypothetical protein [Leptospiraceae bacterium]